jgi:TonB family protein
LDVPPTVTNAPPNLITLPPGIAVGKRIGGKSPKYPSAAKKAHIQGTVILGATISDEGKIVDLHVISGPPELQQASLDAVKTWKYIPFTLYGKPVAVQTQVTVVFALGH